MLFRKKYKKVKAVLKEIDGVVSVKVNLDKKEVTVFSKVRFKERSLYDIITSLDCEVISII